MGGYNITIEGLDKMTEAFDNSPREVGEILETTTKDIGKLLQRTAVMEAPHSTGNLQRSIHMDYSPIQVKVSPSAEYGKFVEFGTLPHSVDPSVLMSWANKNGANPYAVARSIRVKGTKANPFMERTRDKSMESIQSAFSEALQKIIKYLIK